MIANDCEFQNQVEDTQKGNCAVPIAEDNWRGGGGMTMTINKPSSKTTRHIDVKHYMLLWL